VNGVICDNLHLHVHLSREILKAAPEEKDAVPAPVLSTGADGLLSVRMERVAGSAFRRSPRPPK